MRDSRSRSAVVLVDGEHYPPVVRAALADLVEQGTRPVLALFLGGTEKLGADDAPVDVGVPVELAGGGAGDPLPAMAAALDTVLARVRPDVVVDLSDEPVLDHRRRMALASHALHAGVPYETADFRLAPPARPRVGARPAIAVVGTGKRTGKTAVAGDLARRLAAGGQIPVIVAMGRGGPPEPVVVPAGHAPTLEALLAIVDRGDHAASDFYEDALTTGLATVGARRCGGGLAGAVGHSNVPAAVRAADDLPGTVTLLEGSGAALPPVHADAHVLVVPADADPGTLTGTVDRYRVLLADLILVTMVEPPRSSPSQVEAVLGALRTISRDTRVLCTVFRPFPLGQVCGARVFFATTAPAVVSASLGSWLEGRFGCTVVASSSRLADRRALRADLEAADGFDVLLVECKAAAVDVAARIATEVGARVVFCDNRPLVTAGTGASGDQGGSGDVLDRTAMWLAALARDRRSA